MRGGKGNPFRGLLFGAFMAVPLLLAGSLVVLDEYCFTREESRVCEGLQGYLSSRVVMERHVPGSDGNSPNHRTMIYVFGGNQANLSRSYEVAAGLYRRKVSARIHVMSRPGITEFSPEKGRNLTNDEWSVRELEVFGVKPGDVVPVSVPDGLFGTLSEGETIAEIARRNGCRRLVLVSSALHTRRVFDTFLAVIPRGAPEIFVYGADTSPDIDDLLVEYAKLLAYDFVALPVRSILDPH